MGFTDRRVDRLGVVAVDIGDDMPTVRLEAARRIVGEPALGLAVDRDAVVVVERDELGQSQCPGERRGLVRDPLHQAAVADENICAMVDDRVAGAVEFRSQQLFRKRHADRVGESLAERSGCSLDAGRDAELRMAGRLRVQLAETLQFLERQRVAGQMEQRILQHRPVTVGQHEAITVGPMRVRGVVPQMPIPQRNSDFGHAHWHPGMARVRRLHRVHRERADGIGEQCRIGSRADHRSGHPGRHGQRCGHWRRSNGSGRAVGACGAHAPA